MQDPIIMDLDNIAGADQSTVRNENEKLVLHLIEQKGPLSRAELVKLTNISAPTISSIVEEFTDKGLINELEPGASSGGRKPIPLEFNSSLGYVIGIDVGGTNIEIGVADLKGDVKIRTTFSSKEIGKGEKAVDGLAKLANKIIKDSNINKKTILSCCIVVPGITNVKTGGVSLAPAYNWHNYPIKNLLTQKIGKPVYVENDVNAAAFVEKTMGKGKIYSDFIFISVGTGIGAGLIINNRLHRGYNYAAGEIGYIVVDIDWIKEQKNLKVNKNFGCLESLASASAIVNKAKQLNFKKNKIVSARDVIESAKNGNSKANQILDEITDYLASGIINASLVVSPQAVFLGGGIFEAGEIILRPIRKKVEKYSPLDIKIFASSFGQEASIKGAMSIAAYKAKISFL